MLQQLLRDTVQIVRAPLIPGPYNAETYDWANATRTTVAGSVHPVSSTEDVVLQSRTETRWKLYLAPTATIFATDRVEWSGAEFEVDGEPELWKQRGIAHHLKVILRKVSGG